MGGNYLWCLVIVVIVLGLGGAKRWGGGGGFEANLLEAKPNRCRVGWVGIFYGGQSTPVDKIPYSEV